MLFAVMAREFFQGKKDADLFHKLKSELNLVSSILGEYFNS